MAICITMRGIIRKQNHLMNLVVYQRMVQSLESKLHKKNIKSLKQVRGIEVLSDTNEYYAVNFRIHEKNFFSIWISAQNGDSFLKKNNRLLFFLNSEDLYNFCKENSIMIESETLFDFDSIDYTNYNNIINLWNIISDMSKTLGLLFTGDTDEMIDIYKKLLCGCNLPALNQSEEKYTPNFSKAEITSINSVISDMREILRTVFIIK